DVAVLSGDPRHLFIVVATETGLPLRIDREDHASDLALPVIGRGFLYGREVVMGDRVLEIASHAGLEFVVTIIARPAAWLFRMRVYVDGDKLVRIHRPLPLMFTNLRRSTINCSRSLAFSSEPTVFSKAKNPSAA